MDDHITQFKNYLKLADELIATSGKEELAEAARILAMHCAQYQLKYGELPAEEYTALLNLTKLDNETMAILAKGMENLVGVLGTLNEITIDVGGVN